MNIEEILNSNLTKSDKMRRLFDEGKSRKEVALLLGVGYGFVQNVYAKYFSNRPLSQEGDFVRSTSKIVEWWKKKRAKRIKNVLQCPMC